MGEMRDEYKISVGKPQGKSPLGGPRRRWILKDIMSEVVWIQLAQERVQWRDVVNTAMKLLVLQQTGNFLTR
jgi:hypothetical protein